MKKCAKWLVLALCLVLCLSVFAGCGGSDYFLYYDENNFKRRLENMKVEYHSYAPNISQFTMNAFTQNGKAKAKMTFTLARTDDVNKVLQSFKYTVLEDIRFTRLALYQCGGDHYNSPYDINAYGDETGVKGTLEMDVDDKSQKVGYFDEAYQNIKIDNEGFWLSQNKMGSSASRGMVLRKYSAQINGITYTTPEISFHKTLLNGEVTVVGEISVPKEANGVLKAGSVIEGTVEYCRIRVATMAPVRFLTAFPRSISATVSCCRSMTPREKSA